MSGLRTQANELKFRMKLLVGLALLGAFLGALLFTFHFSAWRDMDFIQTAQVMFILAEQYPQFFGTAAATGGFILFWAGLIWIFKPWRDESSAPSTYPRVRKPWEK